MDFAIGIAFLLWLLSPLIGAKLWKRKGGAESIGCLAGLMLGPLVILLAAAKPSEKK